MHNTASSAHSLFSSVFMHVSVTSVTLRHVHAKLPNNHLGLRPEGTHATPMKNLTNAGSIWMTNSAVRRTAVAALNPGLQTSLVP